MPKNVQIRDLDDETYAVLRQRAAAEHLSLTRYLRRELGRWASRPTMAEWLAEADEWRERSGGSARRRFGRLWTGRPQVTDVVVDASAILELQVRRTVSSGGAC